MASNYRIEVVNEKGEALTLEGNRLVVELYQQHRGAFINTYHILGQPPEDRQLCLWLEPSVPADAEFYMDGGDTLVWTDAREGDDDSRD